MREMNSNLRNGVLLFVIVFIIAESCQKTPPHPGEALAETYCSTCHLTPDPSLLTRAVWSDIVLPEMGARLGMKTTFKELDRTREMQYTGLIPKRASMSEASWFAIKSYFDQYAPDTLLVQKNYPIHKGEEELFEIIKLPMIKARSASLVQFDTTAHILWYGNGENEYLYRYDYQTQEYDSLFIDGAPSQILKLGQRHLLLSMGLIHPNDLRQGALLELTTQPLEIKSEILTELRRPVDVLPITQPQGYDFIVNEFGYHLGAFSLYQKTDSSYRQVMLDQLPGAIKSYFFDVNNDDIKDIVVLMAQGDEGIFYYQGKTDGTFAARQPILRFPPSYGSTFFTVTDVDMDGLMDIIYVNGDNGDYEPLMKPYHGVHIFYGQDADGISYEEEAFYQINGAFKVIVEDFDKDDDVDFAVISYFPDADHTPEEGFLYFLQDAGSFKAYSLAISDEGPWLVMDGADYDQDGDTDLVIGSSSTMSDRNASSGVIILKNKTH